MSEHYDLNRKLAEWAEWTWIEGSKTYRGCWRDTDGYYHEDANFTSSLDACFKHLLQPLVEHFIKTTSSEVEYRVRLYEFFMDWLKDFIWNEPHDPTMTLCKTIEKVIISQESKV